MKPWILTVLAIVACLATLSSCEDLSSLIANERELTEFSRLCMNSPIMPTLLTHSAVTIFAFTNDAYNRYNGKYKDSPLLVSYHTVTKLGVTTDFFNSLSLSTEIKGGAPIWVTKVISDDGRGKVTFYANNARIIRKDIKGHASTNELQVLHIIDEVLEPLMPEDFNDISLLNPLAFKLIQNPKTYGIPYQTSEFLNAVVRSRREMVFSGGIGNTFFVPVDSGMTDAMTWQQVDDKVIDSHVVGDSSSRVLFSRAYPKESQRSLAFADNFKVHLALLNESTEFGRSYDLYAQSRAAISLESYPKGAVVAKIILPNIPVKNGVVHFIQTPLVIVNRNIMKYVEQTPSLSTFYGYLREYGQVDRHGFFNLIQALNSGGRTLFVPSNEAFKSVDHGRIDKIFSDEVKIYKMLALHIAKGVVSTDSIMNNEIVTVMTEDPARKLHFEHTESRKPRYLNDVMVMGGGVNATIRAADIAATNGIIHIIDKVLGIPYDSILGLLSKEKSYSYTYSLGTQKDFNTQFSDTDKRFTYFVPTNYAWEKISHQMKSEYDVKIISGNYDYHTEKILQHHLIVNNAYSMAELLNIRKFKTVNAEISLIDRNGRFFLSWEGVEAEIVVPDVDATNGYVHAISTVLMKRSEITTDGSSLSFASCLTMVLSILVVKLLV